MKVWKLRRPDGAFQRYADAGHDLAYGTAAEAQATALYASNDYGIHGLVPVEVEVEDFVTLDVR